MPYKNKSDHFYPLIGVSFRKSEPALYSALFKAAQDTSVTVAEYIRRVIRDRLICDKYLSPDDK